MSDFTREKRWALLAAAEGEELIELADACLAAAREFTVTVPPRAGCVTAQVRAPVLPERFFLGDVLACSAEAELDGVRGWAAGLPEGFTQARRRMTEAFPAGADFLLVAPDGTMAGLPRTTLVEEKEAAA
ncbi:MAG: phosphonate C-P lyase system protein PhnH [Trebonia sp.]